MAKLDRKAYALYINTNFTGSGADAWQLIGKDLEELTVSLNPDVSTQKNILGETTTVDNGYEPQIDANTYYANDDDNLYPQLQKIALERLQNAGCNTKILEVIVNGSSPYTAFTEDVIIKPTSYGGDTSGFQIPFTLYFNGNRKKGTATINTSTGAPTFTPAT